MKSLLFFLPAEALPLVIAGAGFALVLGVVRPRTAFGVIGAFVIPIALTPIIEAAFALLPWWATAPIVLLVAIASARMLLTLVFGRHAAGHIIGSAVVGTAKITAQILIWPIRAAARSVIANRSQ